MNVQLHPKLGLNVHQTFCRRCGGEVNELVMIGTRTSIYKCASCDVLLIGWRPSEPCGKCKSRGPHQFDRKIADGEKLPAGGLCDKCKVEVAEHKEIVAAGGVYWRCKSCPATGVVKPDTDCARATRKNLGIDPPKPCGIEFPTCPRCNDKFYEQTNQLRQDA